VQTLLQRLAPLRHVIGGSFDVKVGQKRFGCREARKRSLR
jgi:hypothetical protein